MEESQFEIDFLAVGTGKRNGDALAIRFGVPSNYKVLVYDGGTKESGKSLVEHIRKHYKTDRVDFVVNSHPDQDHASGLSVVLEELEVGELWMHQPWNYSAEICHYFKDGRITDESLARRLKEKMGAAYALEQLAEEKGVPIFEPFSGSVIGGAFQVLSPGRDWYVHTLVKEFQKSPEQANLQVAEVLGLDALFGTLKKAAESVAEWLEEHWHVETLREDVKTSAENESSVVLFARNARDGLLLTGDAGVRALHNAADFAESAGISLPDVITFTQVPHHGSRHNVSSSVLDRLFGKRLPAGASATKYAIASVAQGCDTHPRRAVSNAFLRRGFEVSKTSGAGILCRFGAPPREGWNCPTPVLPFYKEVEPWE